MISKKIIIEKYASMPDSELIEFAHAEGPHLTSEGIQLLQAEINRRKLTIHAPNITGTGESTDQLDIPGLPDLPPATLSYAFEEIEKGRFIEEILPDLIDAGAEESSTNKLAARLQMKAGEEAQKAETLRLTGVLILISGIAITFLPAPYTSNPLRNIIAWCMIFYGSGRLIKGLYYKAKFTKILKSLQKNTYNSN